QVGVPVAGEVARDEGVVPPSVAAEVVPGSALEVRAARQSLRRTPECDQAGPWVLPVALQRGDQIGVTVLVDVAGHGVLAERHPELLLLRHAGAVEVDPLTALTLRRLAVLALLRAFLSEVAFV